MILAKVLGNIVATQKNARYESARMMLCEHITPEGEPTGHTVLLQRREGGDFIRKEQSTHPTHMIDTIPAQ